MQIKINSNKLKGKLFILGLTIIIMSIVPIFIRGYLGDNFFSINKSFFVPASKILKTNKSNFNFAVASDTGSQNYSLQNIINKIRNSDKKFDFVLYLGDLVTDRPKSHFYWIISEIYPKLKYLPFYTVPGNHDISHDGILNKGYFRAIFGPEYYWFSYGDILFIDLDTSEENVDEEQFNWLSLTLKKIRPLFKRCIIFSHVPPLSPKGEIGHALNVKSVEKLKSIINKNNVDLMLFGHVYYFSKTKFSEIPVYTTPSSGQSFRSTVKKLGYISVEVQNNDIKRMDVNYVDVPRDKEQF